MGGAGIHAPDTWAATSDLIIKHFRRQILTANEVRMTWCSSPNRLGSGLHGGCDRSLPLMTLMVDGIEPQQLAPKFPENRFLPLPPLARLQHVTIPARPSVPKTALQPRLHRSNLARIDETATAHLPFRGALRNQIPSSNSRYAFYRRTFRNCLVAPKAGLPGSRFCNGCRVDLADSWRLGGTIDGASGANIFITGSCRTNQFAEFRSAGRRPH